jgi:hypothetical protein
LDLSFEDLNLQQDGSDAIVNSFEQDLAVLSGINSSDLSADNFIFTSVAGV